MSRYIDADALKEKIDNIWDGRPLSFLGARILTMIDEAPSINIVKCLDCKKSHIGGKITHYLWCVEWGRSTDPFGHCERGEREGE